jgi:hypothetical protein
LSLSFECQLDFNGALSGLVSGPYPCLEHVLAIAADGVQISTNEIEGLSLHQTKFLSLICSQNLSIEGSLSERSGADSGFD